MLCLMQGSFLGGGVGVSLVVNVLRASLWSQPIFFCGLLSFGLAKKRAFHIRMSAVKWMGSCLIPMEGVV